MQDCSKRSGDSSWMAMPALPENTPEATVLVVDDEANIVELLSVSLKFQGFEVHTATNGPAALDKAREVKPDAVILDVMMPGMDGFGAAAPAARRRHRRARAVPDRPGLAARQNRRPHSRRRRLRDQAVQPGRSGGPAASDPAAHRPRCRGAAQRPAHLRRHRARRGHPRGVEGRRAGPAVADGVHPAAVLHHQRGHRAVANPRSSTTCGATTSAATSTSSSPTSPTCAARSTPAINACCTHCGASATFCANRGSFWRTIKGWRYCADEVSPCGSGWWPPPSCWWPAACSHPVSRSRRSCGIR